MIVSLPLKLIDHYTKSKNSLGFANRSKKPISYFVPVNVEWRRNKCKEILNLCGIHTPLKYSNNSKFPIENCMVEEKVSIIPDGNCLFRSLENNHETVRRKLLMFMSTSSLCEKYVLVKNNQKVDEHISKSNLSKLSVWGGDVELFCAAIWLKIDVLVLKEEEWQKFSLMGFNPKRGKNISSSSNIYLENKYQHYEPIISVICKST